MNQGFLAGSVYRGRVLMALSSKVHPDAKRSKSKGSGGEAPPVCDYVLRFDAMEACELPTNKDISIEVCLGPYKVSTKRTTVKVTP